MSAIPTTMRASVLTAPRSIELRQAAVPQPGPRQVLVEVTAVGVCGSDTHFYESGAIGDIIAEGPIVLGHETAGRIVAIGDDVDPTLLGEAVAIEPQTPCRRCRMCKVGSYHLCTDIRFYGAFPVDGSFAEYVVIDSDFAHTVPSALTPEKIALVEPVSVAVHAARRAGIVPGDRVLITGAGPIGVLVAQVARAFGAREAVVSDPVPFRREFAVAHGASRALDPAITDFSELSEHFDIYIDASGSARAVQSAIVAVRRGGTVVLVGMGAETIELPVAVIQHRELTLTGTFRYVNTWPLAIDLIARGVVEVEPLVTGRFGLGEVERALQAAKIDPLAIKSMIVPALDRLAR